MNLVRRAIEAKLDDDATLLALLGDAADTSILAEYDVTARTAKPFLTVRYDGSSGRGHIITQIWTILCAIDPKNDTLHVSSQILRKVKTALDYQFLPISTDSGVYCCEAQWFMDIPTYYDVLYDALVEGQRYHVTVMDA